MNRSLMIALLVAGGLSLYVSLQSDDDLLAASKRGGRGPTVGESAGAARSRPSSPARASSAGSSAPRMEPWVAEALTQGVLRWQDRKRLDKPSASSLMAKQAWASVSPPPPPRVAAHGLALLAPPPMAPPFPHAWVGRFNDESTSTDRPPGVVRAVLVGPQSTWVVRVGDVIEGQWRVDRIQEKTMSLTYLPLTQQQTVAMR